MGHGPMGQADAPKSRQLEALARGGGLGVGGLGGQLWSWTQTSVDRKGMTLKKKSLPELVSSESIPKTGSFATPGLGHSLPIALARHRPS